jgi:hypothetical protein
MGGSSGQPPVQQVTTTTSNLPEYAQPWFETGMGAAQEEWQKDYVPYEGPRMAGYDPLTQQAMRAKEQLFRAGAPQQFQMASDVASQLAYQPSHLGMSIAGGYNPGTLANQQAIQQYMDPYQQLVTDIEKREARRQSEMMGTGIAQQATQAGGLGGYREGIMQAERQRNLGQQLGDIQTRGGQAAYQQAQQAFERDRAAQLGAAQLGMTGLSADQATRNTQLQAAQLLGGFGPQAYQGALQRIEGLGQVGAGRQAQTQQQYDMMYQDFLRQQEYPEQKLSKYFQMLHGIPVAPSTVQTKAGGPSGWSQALGGIAALSGMYGGRGGP